MICSSGEMLNTGGGCNDGDWTTAVSCPGSTAICGYHFNFQLYTNSGDNTAVNDIKFHCCKVCKYTAGMYRSTLANLCYICDKNCLTCYGTSTKCTSCAGSDTLTSGKCVNLNNFIEYSMFNDSATFVNDIKTNIWKKNNANINPAIVLCGIYMTLGFFGQNDYLTGTYTSLYPHYRGRLKLRIYKIDLWNSEIVTVSVDGNALKLPQLQFTSNDNLFFGNLCNNLNYQEDTAYVDIEFPHYDTTMTIQITSNIANSLAFWSAAHITYGIYLCDSACLTCSGPLNTNCLTCYSNGYLLANGTCGCNDGYLSNIVTIINTYTQTYCAPCSTGCKTCTGNLTNQCTSCLSSYYLYNSNQVISK